MACCPSCRRGGSGAIGTFEREGEISTTYLLCEGRGVDYPDVCGVGIVKCKVNGFFFLELLVSI